jgi:hypothetical protein
MFLLLQECHTHQSCLREVGGEEIGVHEELEDEAKEEHEVVAEVGEEEGEEEPLYRLSLMSQ